jgi:hypothetical protein
VKTKRLKARDTAKVATMDQYRFISIERDTTYLDTASRSRENTVLIICERITLDFGSPMKGKRIIRFNIV